MTIDRLPWPDAEIGSLEHALRKWLQAHTSGATGDRARELLELPGRLAADDWLWADQDSLPLPRGQWVALLAETIGHAQLPVDIPGAIRDAACTESDSGVSWAAFSACGWVSGAGRALVDATVDFVGIRKQFGQTIGQFQVVQHRAVDMYADTESMHALLWTVAASLKDTGTADGLDALVDVCWRYWRRVSQAAVQLHGAIAMTHDLPVGTLVLHGESILARYAQPMVSSGRRAASFLNP